MSVFQLIGGFSLLQPEVIAWGTKANSLFAFAVGHDLALWYSRMDGFMRIGKSVTGWSEWRSLGGVVTSRPSAVLSGESSVDVFAVGQHSELLHWQFRDGVWIAWPINGTTETIALSPGVVPTWPQRFGEALGGILTSPLQAVMFGDLNDKTLVFGRGTDSALWLKERIGDTWQDWQSLGFVLSSAPSAVVWQRQTLTVFALGADSGVWYTMGGEWQRLQGEFSSAPYAVASRDHIHVFVADAKRALNHKAWDGNSWSPWQNLGGILMRSPTANSFYGNEVLRAYALGTDSAIWHIGFDGAAWSGWESFGGPFLTPPATVTRGFDWAPARDMIAMGTDHALHFFETFDP